MISPIRGPPGTPHCLQKSNSRVHTKSTINGGSSRGGWWEIFCFWPTGETNSPKVYIQHTVNAHIALTRCATHCALPTIPTPDLLQIICCLQHLQCALPVIDAYLLVVLKLVFALLFSKLRPFSASFLWILLLYWLKGMFLGWQGR